MGKDDGFTIVELLIVIVVIGILAAITIVAFNGVQQKARTAAQQSTAKQVEQQIMTHALQVNSKSVSISGSLIGYQDSAGQTTLLKPLTGTTDITMYVVYAVTATTENYGAPVQLIPATAGNIFRIQTSGTGSTSMSYRIDTPTQSNVSGTAAGFRTVGKTLVGWIQASNNATTYAYGYNQAAPYASGALSASSGWNFSGMEVNSNGSGTTQIALVFNTAQDQDTREQIISWLVDKYNLSL